MVFKRDIIDQASATLRFVIALRRNMHDFPYRDEASRTVLSRDLLLSSTEHSAAIASLVHRNATSYVVSTVSLLRPMYEHLARGMFFGSPTGATDQEITTFLEKDQMPARPQSQGKNRTITFQQLLDFAGQEIDSLAKEAAPDATITMSFGAIKDEMNSFIHGGVVAPRVYRKLAQQDRDGRKAEAALGECLKRSGAMAFIAFTYAMCRLCDHTKVHLTEGLQEATLDFFLNVLPLTEKRE